MDNVEPEEPKSLPDWSAGPMNPPTYSGAETLSSEPSASVDGAPVAGGAAADVPGGRVAADKPRWKLAMERARRSRRSAHRKHGRGRASKFELPILIVVAVAIAILLKTFVVQPFYIPSQSMENTLYGCPGCSGDRILVFKPVYHVRDPHSGDIVVFKAPTNWDEGKTPPLSSNPIVHAVQWFGQLVGFVPPSEKDLVKRVIAVGGQTIKCCDENGNVQVSENGPNGPWRSLNEPYIFEPSPWSGSTVAGPNATSDSRSFGPVTVPKGRLWVMGDHRSDSADSRYHCGQGGVGPGCDPTQSTVAVKNVVGKAVAIAWPPSRWRTLGTPTTFTAISASMLDNTISDPVPAVVFLGSLTLFGRRRMRRIKGRGRCQGRGPLP